MTGVAATVVFFVLFVGELAAGVWLFFHFHELDKELLLDGQFSNPNYRWLVRYLRLPGRLILHFPGFIFAFGGDKEKALEYANGLVARRFRGWEPTVYMGSCSDRWVTIVMAKAKR